MFQLCILFLVALSTATNSTTETLSNSTLSSITIPPPPPPPPPFVISFPVLQFGPPPEAPAPIPSPAPAPAPAEPDSIITLSSDNTITSENNPCSPCSRLSIRGLQVNQSWDGCLFQTEDLNTTGILTLDIPEATEDEGESRLCLASFSGETEGIFQTINIPGPMKSCRTARSEVSDGSVWIVLEASTCSSTTSGSTKIKIIV